MSNFDFSLKASEIIALLSILLTMGIFIFQQFRLVRVQKQQTYQRLELASNELFRFAASNAGVLVRYQPIEKDPSVGLTDIERLVADNHIFQTLNLFEMAARLRQANFFEDEVFGSWVIWYYDLLQSWYFRETWKDIRPNYTTEMRLVFDGPIEKFDPRADEDERKRQFFAHVAKVLRCPRVKSWLDDMA
jgi:hypothetical protein